MSTYQWLLALHVTGAFFLLGGAVLSAVFNVSALRSKRPSEIVVFVRLTRFAVIAVVLGALLTLVLGIWLVHERDYSFGTLWISLSFFFWVVAVAAGRLGGLRDGRTRTLAAQLATESNVVTPELRALQTDPLTLSLSYGSGLASLTILALMIWKPGA